jgi:hypothetical protein
MAQINPRDINYETECYAAVEMDFGFRCGKLKGWKLYDLKNPDLFMTLSQIPSEILAAFETQEELEQWRRKECGIPEPSKSGQALLFDSIDEEVESSEVKLKTVGNGKDKLIISQIL